MVGPTSAKQDPSQAMRFDAYVERCLYDPEHGFYRSGVGRAGGRHGDFITSPEVGPLFATIIGRALDQWWLELGRPDPFMVYDVGTGPGTLARQLSTVPGPSLAARSVVGLDRSDVEEGGQPDLAGAVVLANELLDNLPFRLIETTEDGWNEIYVAIGPDGAVGERSVDADASDPGLARAVATVADAELLPGTRVPVQTAARDWVGDVLGRGAARIVVFDYGAETTAELVRRGGWLRTYRDHERGTDPLVEPGRWDITTDVGFDQLPEPTALTTQAEFLRSFDIDGLVEEGRDHWRAHAARPDLEAMKMRSRVREAEALLDPAGLGSWIVATWQQG